MFSFHQPRTNNVSHSQAITEREHASLQSLHDAFGTQADVRQEQTFQPVVEAQPTSQATQDFGQGTPRVPATNPTVMHPCVSVPEHIAPLGHTIEDHHIWENCPQGRKREHGPDAIAASCPQAPHKPLIGQPPLHNIPYGQSLPPHRMPNTDPSAVG